MQFPGCENALKYVYGRGSALDSARELAATPQLPSWIKGGLLLKERDEKRGERRRRKGGVHPNKNLPPHH